MYGRTQEGELESSDSARTETAAGTVHYLGLVLPVFGLLLLVTTAVIWVLVTNDLATALFDTFGFVGILMLFVAQFILAMAVSIIRDAYPLNVLVAVAFAAFQGVWVAPAVAGALSAGHAVVLIQALVLTAGIFIALAAIPALSGRRFGFLGGALAAGLLVLVSLGLLGRTMGIPSGGGLVFNGSVLVLFGSFVLYDVSKLLEEEYDVITGALTLYLDFTMIFLSVLRLLDRR